MTPNNLHFFWNGPFSQWYISPFTIDGQTFNTCEQWMMYNKAKMFGDGLSAIAIMHAKSPATQKKLGREVVNFDDAVWMQSAYDIVVVGNRAKFAQNPVPRAVLERTKGQLIVEASPYDRRWGIGMAANAPGIEDPANWRGDNLLGEAVTQVRIEMFGS